MDVRDPAERERQADRDRRVEEADRQKQLLSGPASCFKASVSHSLVLLIKHQHVIFSM